MMMSEQKNIQEFISWSATTGQRVNAGNHKKPKGLSNILFQQNHTSRSFPNSSTHWELSVKTYESAGHMLPTIPCTQNISENAYWLIFLQFNTS